MDLATVGGFLFSMVMIAVGAYFEHVTVKSMLGLSAFLIVIGGSIGATMFSHTMEELRQVPRALKRSLFPPKLDSHAMVDLLVGLAEKARRNGLLSLQEDANSAVNPLIQRGLTLAVDGNSPEAVQETLQLMSDLDGEEAAHAGAVFDTLGGYAPTVGILGTVMGLVTVMGNLSEPEKLGPAIAVAFLATLYGVGFANLVFLPLGAKIKGIIKQQGKFNEMIIIGILGLQVGDNPRGLREKLEIYAGTHHAKSGGATRSPGTAAAREEA